MKYLWFLALSALLGLGACDKTEEKRCEELDEIIDAKASQLPDYCEDDIDCLLVDIHPGLTVAANDVTLDAELDQVKARRVELCGEFEDDFKSFVAECDERTCVAIESGVVDRPDTGSDLPDGTCEVGDDCERGNLCVQGTCRPLCADACRHVEECGVREELGLGSSQDNCVDRCDEFARPAGEEGLTLARCLIRGACGNLDACF